MFGTIQLSRFHKAVGDAGKSCFHDNHIICAKYAGNNQHPKGIDQAKGLDIQVCRDQTAAEIHGDNNEDSNHLIKHQPFSGKRIGGQKCHDHI